MKRALLDTSFVTSLARGEGVALEDPPEEAAISAVTLCGLHHGVLVATDEQRPGRLATLSLAERRFAALPIDSRIAPYCTENQARRQRAALRYHQTHKVSARPARGRSEAYGAPIGP